MGIVIVMHFDMLFQLKNLKLILRPYVTRGHNVSMQGVGIVLGIVKHRRLFWRG